MFPPKRRTCHAVNLAFAACEHDMCLLSRLNTQRQSVSQSVSPWYPCGRALCWGSDLHRQKSYQNAQQQSGQTPPPPLDQQNGNSQSVESCTAGLTGWSNYSVGNTKWFRIHFIWPHVLFFLSALQTQGSCKRPGYRCALKRSAWDLQSGYQRKVGEAERRRWEGVYAWGCLKMTGAFTNEEILHIGVGMQACITSRWQWLAGPTLVGFVANWCWVLEVMLSKISPICLVWHTSERHLTVGQAHSLWFLCRAGSSGGRWRAATLKPASELWNMSFEPLKEALTAHESAWFTWNTCMNRHSWGWQSKRTPTRGFGCSHMCTSNQGDLLTCDLCAVHACCHESLKHFHVTDVLRMTILLGKMAASCSSLDVFFFFC